MSTVQKTAMAERFSCAINLTGSPDTLPTPPITESKEHQIMRTSIEIAKGLTRATILHAAFRAHRKMNPASFNYLEIGTAFSANEGLSTLLAAVFLKECGAPGKVMSIDIDESHVKASHDILCAESPDLAQHVAYFLGNSFEKLPPALGELNGVDIAFIDGGGDALVNLYEFDLILGNLNSNGIIVVDDCHYLPKTTYRARRDFGKAQLIYPLLLLSDTLNYQVDKWTAKSGSRELAIDAMKDATGFRPFLSPLLGSESFMNLALKLSHYAFFKVSSLLVICEHSVLKEGFGLDPDENLSNLPVKRFEVS